MCKALCRRYFQVSYKAASVEAAEYGSLTLRDIIRERELFINGLKFMLNVFSAQFDIQVEDSVSTSVITIEVNRNYEDEAAWFKDYYDVDVLNTEDYDRTMKDILDNCTDILSNISEAVDCYNNHFGEGNNLIIREI